MAFLDVDNPEIVVTETYGEGKIMPGEYVITIPEDGYVEILVQYAETGNSEKFIFEDKDDQTVLRLSKGDSVTLTGYANKTRYALFYLIEQYDESTPM